MLESVYYRHLDQTMGIVCQHCHRPICPRCVVAGSVRFQCPDCVAAGCRQTRRGRLPCDDTHSTRPTLTSQVLVRINVVIWLAILLTGDERNPLFKVPAIQAQGFCTTEHYILAVDPPAQYAAIGAT